MRVSRRQSDVEPASAGVIHAVRAVGRTPGGVPGLVAGLEVFRQLSALRLPKP